MNPGPGSGRVDHSRHTGPVRRVHASASAVSHRLRLRRALELVTGTRTGRSIAYSLCDNHIAELLDAAVYHIEHVRLGVRDTTA